MLAHVLRMDPNAPTQRALDFAFIGSQTQIRKAVHKPAGNTTCRPQAGRTRTPPYSETIALSTATCPQQATLIEDQREGLIAAAGCHSYYRDCSTQSIIILI